MKFIVAVVSLLLAGTGGAHGQPAQKSAAECGSDQLGKYMNMSPEQFDGTLGEGWRVVGDTAGCEQAAADLIAMYRNEIVVPIIAQLDGHEAQLRAASGDYVKAAALYRSKLATLRVMAVGTDDPTDVLYVEATIAFLERDRALLEAKRAELAAVPKPDWYDAAAADAVRRNPNAAASMAWPRNLNVVDGLIACFDKPYVQAYSFSCQPKR